MKQSVLSRTGLYLDEESNPVQVVYPVDSMDQDPEQLTHDEVRAVRLETIKRLLQFVDSSSPDAKKVGLKLCFLAFLVEASTCKTQRELAKRLGYSPARVSQKLNAARKEFAHLYEAP